MERWLNTLFNHLFLIFLETLFYLEAKTLYSTYGAKLKNELLKGRVRYVKNYWNCIKGITLSNY